MLELYTDERWVLMGSDFKDASGQETLVKVCFGEKDGAPVCVDMYKDLFDSLRNKVEGYTYVISVYMGGAMAFSAHFNNKRIPHQPVNTQESPQTTTDNQIENNGKAKF